MKYIRLALLFIWCITPNMVFAVTASWTANTEEDLAGYKLYYQINNQPAMSVDVGNVTTWELPDADYDYVNLTAYDLFNNESNPCPDVKYIRKPKGTTNLRGG